MTDERAEMRLKNAIEEIRDLEGRGTELVTLYIPPDDNLRDWISRLNNEYSQADNIKSKRTRSNVQDALNKAKATLQQYSEVPENGLAVFVGKIDSADEFKQYVFDELPREVNQSNYICDDHFHTETIESIITPDETYGLVVLDRNEATIAELIGERIDVYQHLDSNVMNQHNAGGFSNLRFDRLIEEQKENFFKEVAEQMQEAFLDEGKMNVEGILLGGTDITIDNFTNGGYLDYRLDEAVLSTFNVSYANESGLNQLVSKAQSVLEAHEQGKDKGYMEDFLERLSSEDKHATYGYEEVQRALNYGAVDTLLISEKFAGEVGTLSCKNDHEQTIMLGEEDRRVCPQCASEVEIAERKDAVDYLAELAEQRGTDVKFISADFEQGDQLVRVFGGIAALLRYEV